MSCNCRNRVDEDLAVSNARIAVGFMVSGSVMDISPPMIVLEKRDAGKRGKLPTLLATYCPFCGTRYEPEAMS